MDLPFCFALVAAFGIGLYVIADGFDLGVGILFLLAPREADRDVMMESISPFWDGNETWLVLGGSLLLAAFPVAYYVLLPALYMPIMFMLLALILRGISFEFRFRAGHLRRVWDYAFAAGSVLAAVMQGFVLGGFIQGIPMKDGAFAGSAFGFLGALGILCALGLVGGYALLGAGWLIWKTSGATQIFAREVGRAALIFTAAMMALVSLCTALTQPAIAQRWFSWPQLLPEALLPLATICVVVLLWRSLWGARDNRSFLLTIALFLLGFGGLAVSLWPYVVPRHETIWDAAADRNGLQFIGVGLAILLPIILSYLGHAYWVFRGKATATYDQSIGTNGEINARHTSAPANKLRSVDVAGR